MPFLLSERYTHFACSARAMTPAALGAAADVPPCECEHLFFPLSVVVYNDNEFT